MREDVLWQSGLQEDILDFDAGNESVVVGVGLLEQRRVPKAVAGVDDPRNGLDAPGLRRGARRLQQTDLSSDLLWPRRYYRRFLFADLSMSGQCYLG